MQLTQDIIFIFFHSTLDADDSGYLDLREFLLAIELVAARTPEEKLIWAFRQYDRDNSGQLDQAEMSKAMKSIYYMLNSIGDAPKNNPEENIVFKFEIYFQSFLDILYVKSSWWSPCSFNPL